MVVIKIPKLEIILANCESKSRHHFEDGRMNFNEVNTAIANVGLITLFYGVRGMLYDMHEEGRAGNPEKTLHLFPRKQLFTEEVVGEYKRMIRRKRGRFSGNDLLIVGLSVYDETLPLAIEFSKYTHTIENALVVAGGPSFAIKDDERYRSLLEGGVFDVVNVGHGSPFVDLVRNILAGKISIDRPDQRPILEGDVPNGLRYMGREGYSGKGTGDIPYMGNIHPFNSNILFSKRKQKAKVYTYLGTSCRNKCDYCAIRMPEKEIEPEAVAEKLNYTFKIFSRKRIISFLQIEDPNVLSCGNIDSLVSFSKELARQGRTIKEYGVFFDPYIFSGSHRKKVIKAINDLNITFFYIGRDISYTNDIGARFEGRILTKEMMAIKDKRLDEFIRFLKTTKGRRLIELSYIMTPFETEESVKARIEDTITFVYRAEGTNISTSCTYHALQPFYGTKLCANYKGRFVPHEALKPIHSMNILDVWDYSFSGSHFLDYFSIFNQAQLRNIGSFRGTSNNITYFGMTNMLAVQLGFGDFSKGFDPEEEAKKVYGGFWDLCMPNNPKEREDFIRKCHDSRKGFCRQMNNLCHRIYAEKLYEKSSEKKAALKRVYMEILPPHSPQEGDEIFSSIFLDFLRTKERYLAGSNQAEAVNLSS